MQTSPDTPSRLAGLLASDRGPLLSLFYTAGFPHLDDTVPLAQTLEAAGADLLEIGIPYSDPLADGPVIQQSSSQALAHGMRLSVLFQQLKSLRPAVQIPVILMGYWNPVLQYGVEKFCAEAQACGVDGLILPDLPIDLYERQYKALFARYGLLFNPLVTENTPLERLHRLDAAATGFVYAVSSAATTGGSLNLTEERQAYFTRLASAGLQHPVLIGFGIDSGAAARQASQSARGVIVGSALIRHLQAHPETWTQTLPAFVSSLHPASVSV